MDEIKTVEGTPLPPTDPIDDGIVVPDDIKDYEKED